MEIIKTINHVKVEPVFVDSNGVTRADVIIGAEVFVSATKEVFESSMKTSLPLAVEDLSDFVAFSSADNDLVMGWLDDQIDPIVAALEEDVLAKANRTVQIRVLS